MGCIKERELGGSSWFLLCNTAISTFVEHIARRSIIVGHCRNNRIMAPPAVVGIVWNRVGTLSVVEWLVKVGRSEGVRVLSFRRQNRFSVIGPPLLTRRIVGWTGGGNIVVVGCSLVGFYGIGFWCWRRQRGWHVGGCGSQWWRWHLSG